MRSFCFSLQYLTCQSFKRQVCVSLVIKRIRAHNLTINIYYSNLLHKCQLTWSPRFIHSSTCSQVSQLLSVLSAFVISETSHTVKSPVVCPERHVQHDVMWCDVQSVWVWCCAVLSILYVDGAGLGQTASSTLVISYRGSIDRPWPEVEGEGWGMGDGGAKSLVRQQGLTKISA